VLFRDGATHGLTVIETKAYEHNVAAAMNSCAVFFGEIDDGVHNPRLRQVVSTLRSELDDQANISDGLWKDRRCYFPNVHYDHANAVDWAAARAEFALLKPGPANIFVMPHAIADFSGFFTQLADQMRVEADTLSNV
jgi:hypothetical protein